MYVLYGKFGRNDKISLHRLDYVFLEMLLIVTYSFPSAKAATLWGGVSMPSKNHIGVAPGLIPHPFGGF